VTALVVGAARSGVAVANYLVRQGERVIVTDRRPRAELESAMSRLPESAELRLGGYDDSVLAGVDTVYASPGVPWDAELLNQARAKGIPVSSEIDLFLKLCPGTVVGVTGTNGKTTTTALTGEVLSAGERPVMVGGNIGTAAISFVGKATAQTWIVLEVSSFQLETIKTFRPRVAVILNITPDHLDRHHTFEAYRDAKARIFENQRADDFTVLNADDPTCKQLGSRVHSELYWFSRKSRVTRGAFVHGNEIVWRDHEEQRVVMPVSEIPLKGAHNLENVLAAVATGILAGVKDDAIRAAVRAFKAVEHRLEYVATIGGVEYYNDSKATNVDAVEKALRSLPGRSVLIAGGRDKGLDFAALKEVVAEKVKLAVLIGQAQNKMWRAWSKAVPCVRAFSMEEAVRVAAGHARSGDTVLLSPACASFDMFENYEHRGEEFKRQVFNL
jgi:UDP-N-acetylmuramoylalanine--D-glutamate ligase